MNGFRFPGVLYPIIDTLGDSSVSHLDLASAVIAGGCRLVQLRMKQASTAEFVTVARALRAQTAVSSTLLIINDRADIAKLVDADGVHLGQEDLPAVEARAILGADKIIGISTHNPDQARAAATSGVADYIGFGPVFPTSSKENPDPVQGLEVLREVCSSVDLPVVAIGGITEVTMPEVLHGGADAVAMIGAVVRAADPTALVRKLLARAR